MARHDFLLDENGDLKIENGDFVISESDLQHVELILSATKGSFKEFPTLGVGLANFINKQDVVLTELRRAIEVNLKADGYTTKRFDLKQNGEFDIDFELV